MGTLELTRDTRRLRWPLSLTRAHQKNFRQAKDYQPFLDDLSESSNPHCGKEVQFGPEGPESQGCLSTTSQSRTPAATLSSLSRCLSPAREVVSRWLCLLHSPGGMTTGLDPHPAGVKQAGISHQRGGGKQQKIKMTHFHPVAKNNDIPRVQHQSSHWLMYCKFS